MKIATTTEDFFHYLKNDLDKLQAIKNAGFSCVDFSMYQLSPDSEYLKEGWQDQVLKLKEKAKELKLEFVQAHSQGGAAFSKDPSVREHVVKCTLRSIEICDMLGIKNTVVHAGISKELDKKSWFEKNKEYYLNYLNFAEKYNVNILTENACACNLAGMYHANTGKEMLEFINYVNHPLFHVCWDTGHANADHGNQYDDIIALKDHLYAIHYNDNNGKEDEHRPPYFGTLHNDEVINALIDIGFKGPFTLECCSPIIPSDNWIKPRNVFAKDTRALEPTFEMQLDLIKYTRKVAEYLLSLYGIKGE